jgi:hypothetical protein
MEIIGYLAAILIGISLGLIGGGGSILTVPVLVFLFLIEPEQATSYSLFIVGTTSLIGAINNYRNDCISFRTVKLFGLSSVITVFITRKFIIPLIPKILFIINGWEVKESFITMIFFAILMLLSSVSMIRGKERITSANENEATFYSLFFYGVGIGIVTGLLGAGGGFLLIPTLVVIVGLPMKKAIGTSLLIIALNSLIGFLGDIGHFMIDWKLLLTLTSIAIAGIFIGGWLGKRISGSKLRTGFGWFILAMAIYVVMKEMALK